MWRVAGSSIVGTAHQRSGQHCQDYFAVVGAKARPDRLAIAVADGAGSAPKGAVGAQMAVEFLLGITSSYERSISTITEQSANAWLSSLRNHFQQRASTENADVCDYATTLLFAVLEGSAGYFFQLGDGCWIIETKHGIEAATWPTTGEYVNETVFVTSENAIDLWTHSYHENVLTVLGCTDGLEHLCLDFRLKRPHYPIVKKLFRAVHATSDLQLVTDQITSLLGSGLVNERTDDDKTLALAWRPADTDAN